MVVYTLFTLANGLGSFLFTACFAGLLAHTRSLFADCGKYRKSSNAALTNAALALSWKHSSWGGALSLLSSADTTPPCHAPMCSYTPVAPLSPVSSVSQGWRSYTPQTPCSTCLGSWERGEHCHLRGVLRVVWTSETLSRSKGWSSYTCERRTTL